MIDGPMGGAQPCGRLRFTLFVAVLVAVVASGCGAGGEGGSAVPTETSTQPRLTTTTFQSVLDASEGAARSIEDDVAEIIGDIAPPEGERFVEGSVEYFEWVGDCAELLGASVAVTVSPPSIFAAEGPSIERDGQVVSACLDAAEEQPWFVRYPFDGSVEANRLRYQLELEIYECLRDNGYPTVDPPSEEAFVSGEADWSAYAAIGFGLPLYVNPFLDPPPGSAEQLEAQELCGASLAVLYQERILNPSS